MSELLTLYHGSSQVIERPELAKGKLNNDYGRGFYCTQSLELAKEWACSTETDGFANSYRLSAEAMSVLNLSNGEYHILNWLAILLENRTFRISSNIAQRAHEYILKQYMIAYKKYDVIKGYRADDSYFSFANAFLNNTISLAQLEKAMVLGNLGEQVVLQSEAAFEALTYVESIPAPRTIYLSQKLARDEKARTEFRNQKMKPSAENEIYIMDIIRGRWENDDSRIQRILPR